MELIIYIIAGTKKSKKGAGLVRELGGGYLNTCKQFF